MLCGPRELAEAGAPEALLAAAVGAETGALALAFDPRDAEAYLRARSAPRAAIDVCGFVSDDGAVDAPSLETAVRLWITALEIECAAGFAETPPEARARADWRARASPLRACPTCSCARCSPTTATRAERRPPASWRWSTRRRPTPRPNWPPGSAPMPNGPRTPRRASTWSQRRRPARPRWRPAAWSSAERAAARYAEARKLASKSGLRNAESTALFFDPELTLRLGRRLGTAPWSGATVEMETADGELAPVWPKRRHRAPARRRGPREAQAHVWAAAASKARRASTRRRSGRRA